MLKDKVVDLRILGKNIKKYRIEKKLTQEKLAALTNLSIQYIGNIERGNTTSSLETIMKICIALDVTPNQLLLSSSKPTLNTLIHQILESLSDQSISFLVHIYNYIQLLKKDKLF
jgi:transcriptional regulator with XRE-family HTH domain